MYLNIELPYDLETQLREQARQKGKALNQYVLSLIQEKTRSSKAKTIPLSSEETALFHIINKGFSDIFWTNLHLLDKKRQNITLTETERQTLIAMTNELEIANLERMKALVKLATIRETDLDTLMTDLGLNNGKHH